MLGWFRLAGLSLRYNPCLNTPKYRPSGSELRAVVLDHGSGGTSGRPMMVCELFLLTSIWFLFVIFWMETISVWLFLCNFYQDRAFYHWGDGVFADDPGHMLYMLGSMDGSGQAHT
ncbi:hypothetical protein GJAV_G00057680 [Gymnothorax javanicus]|nr:hypothetical protein GJAV_G00057680 [Gymnothorax javanicus]